MKNRVFRKSPPAATVDSPIVILCVSHMNVYNSPPAATVDSPIVIFTCVFHTKYRMYVNSS